MSTNKQQQRGRRNGAGQKAERKIEGLVNGFYIGWNLGMWWAWLIFAIAFFTDTHVCELTH